MIADIFSTDKSGGQQPHEHAEVVSADVSDGPQHDTPELLSAAISDGPQQDAMGKASAEQSAGSQQVAVSLFADASMPEAAFATFEYVSRTACLISSLSLVPMVSSPFVVLTG
ncbi:hypothetical protein ACFL0Q_00205 [Thermodesulfobacteriota bacterium]